MAEATEDRRDEKGFSFPGRSFPSDFCRRFVFASNSLRS